MIRFLLLVALAAAAAADPAVLLRGYTGDSCSGTNLHNVTMIIDACASFSNTQGGVPCASSFVLRNVTAGVVYVDYYKGSLCPDSRFNASLTLDATGCTPAETFPRVTANCSSQSSYVVETFETSDTCENTVRGCVPDPPSPPPPPPDSSGSPSFIPGFLPLAALAVLVGMLVV